MYLGHMDYILIWIENYLVAFTNMALNKQKLASSTVRDEYIIYNVKCHIQNS